MTDNSKYLAPDSQVIMGCCARSPWRLRVASWLVQREATRQARLGGPFPILVTASTLIEVSG